MTAGDAYTGLSLQPVLSNTTTGTLEPSYSAIKPSKSVLPSHSSTLPTSKSILPTQPSSLPSAKQQQMSDAYLSDLLSFSLDRLRKEPDILKDEKQQLERTLQATSVSNYRAFITTADCLATISSELSYVCEHLDLLLQGIPELAKSCEAFSANSSEVMQAYAHSKQLANHQSSLLELLELPQLMDTCVRNGVYDEALDLQAFVSRMALLHPHLPLVKILTAQVHEVSQSMLHQLLARLKTGIQLPECLRVMGYLRRMVAFSESDLRLHFLQCRDEWISSLIEELDEGDAYDYVKHLTDIHRLHLFDAIMQYRAIFFDGGAAAGAAGQAAAGVGAAAALSAVNPVQDAAALAASVRETSLLHSWVQQRLSLYIAALKQHLPAITQGGSLASTLEHCMYCGSSLARVGLDFQGLLMPLFESCSLNLLSQHLAAALDLFNTKLESHKWVPMHTSLTKSQQDNKDAVKSGDETGAKKSESGTEDSGAPPYILLEYPPLAMFTNGVLNAFNELRQCALQSCAKPAAGLLQQTVEHVSASLMHYQATHSLTDSEATLFRSAVKAALDVLLPFLSSCYTRVFHGVGHKLDCSGAVALLRNVLQES